MFDFTENIKEKLTLDQHEKWRQYILSFHGYTLYIQMPNQSEDTIELFVNEGKKELLGGVLLQPNEYDKLADVINNGGIYVQERRHPLGIRKDVYLRGINLPENASLDKMDRVY